MNLPHSLLLAHNDSAFRTDTAALLSRAGYKVLTAATGAQAIETALATLPHLILLDASLRDLDGATVLRRMRADPALEAVPVILLAEAGAPKTHQAAALEAGADGYITRPVVEDEFLAYIHAHWRMADMAAELRHRAEELAQAQAAALNMMEDAVAARQRAESALEALRERERQLAALMANLPGMAYRCANDPQRTMQFVSQGALGLTGYRAADLCGNARVAFADLIHPEDRARVWTAVQAAVDQDRPYVLEYRIRDADGAERWVWERGSAVRDAQGRVEALEGFIADITEQRRMQEDLRASEERYRRIVETSHEGIWAIDAASRTCFVNQRIQEMLGYTAAQMMGRPLTDFLAPEDIADHQVQLHARQEGKPGHFERRYRHASGAWRWMSVSATPQWDAAGQFAGSFAMFTDITDRKQAEEALEAERALLRTLVDNLPVSIYLKDLEGRKLLANPVDVHHLGAACEAEVLGKTDYDFFPEALARQFQEDERRVIETGQPLLNREEKLTRPDGTQRWLLTSKVPRRDLAGRITGIIGIGLDITDRRQAEQDKSLLARSLAASVNEIYLFDAATLRFQFVSEGAQRHLGYTMEQLRAMTPLDLKPEFDQAAFEALVRPLLRHEKPVQVFETVHRRANGTLYPVEVRLQLFEHETERVFLAVITDTTERKQAENALRRSEALFRSVWECSQDGMRLTDGEGRMLRVNGAFCALVGLSRGELEGRLLADVYAPEDREHILRRYRERYARRQFEPYMEKQLRLWNGRSIWLAASTALLDPGDAASPVLDVFRDITDRRRAEAVQAQQLNELQRWHDATLGREMRVLELKREVNRLLAELGRPARFVTAANTDHDERP